jgi:hypothetical protein
LLNLDARIADYFNDSLKLPLSIQGGKSKKTDFRSTFSERVSLKKSFIT